MEGIEIIDFQPEGYKPLVDYESWRVAVLKFCDDLLIENVKTMQKHLYTDEVFVLVQGRWQNMYALIRSGYLKTYLIQG